MRTEWGEGKSSVRLGLMLLLLRAEEEKVNFYLCLFPAHETSSRLWDKQHRQWCSGHFTAPCCPVQLCPFPVHKVASMFHIFETAMCSGWLVLGSWELFALYYATLFCIFYPTPIVLLYSPPFIFIFNFFRCFPRFYAFPFSIHHGARSVSLLAVVLPLLSQNIFIQSKGMTKSPFGSIRWFLRAKLNIYLFSLNFLSQCPHESRNITEPTLLLEKPGQWEISFSSSNHGIQRIL